MKRCGKSAPRRRQRRRHGKPHREQDQVGAAGAAACGRNLRAPAPGGPSRRRSGRSHEAPGDGRPRGMAAALARPALRRARGGTEPGLQTVWRPSQHHLPGLRSSLGLFRATASNSGRTTGRMRDKCGFQGATLWIRNSGVACRGYQARVGACRADAGRPRATAPVHIAAGMPRPPRRTPGGWSGRSPRDRPFAPSGGRLLSARPPPAPMRKRSGYSDCSSPCVTTRLRFGMSALARPAGAVMAAAPPLGIARP